MSDNKMLQAILDNVVEIKSDIKNLREETRTGLKRVNGRIDLLGKELAVLDEDAPTREEYDKQSLSIDNHEKRIKRVEKKLALT